MLVRTTARLISLLLLLSLIGCSDEKKTEPVAEDPFRGLEVHIVLPAGFDLQNSWQPILDEWSAQTGASCVVDEYSSIDLKNEQKDWTLLRDGNGKFLDGSQPALVVYPTTETTLLNERGLLAAIPEQVQGESQLQWLDLFNGLRESVAMIQEDLQKQPVAHPISNPVLVCYYRKDLLDAAGLNPPNSWQEYDALVDGLKDWAGGLSAVEPWHPSYRSTMYLARAISTAKHPSNYSLFLDIQSGEPLINRPSFVRVLEQVGASIKKLPAETLEFTPADCRRELMAGRAALAIAFETGPGNPRIPFTPDATTDSKTKGEAPSESSRAENIEIDFFRLPGATEFYNCSTDEWTKSESGEANRTTLSGFGGLSIGVSKTVTEVERQAAWNLLATIVVENTNSAFPAATKSMCRQSQRDIAAVWLGEDLTNEERQQYIDVVTESLNDRNLVAELPILNRTKFRTALSAGVTNVVTSDMSAQESLNEVAKKWSEIIAADEDSVVNSYRHSLGLPSRVSISE